MVVCAEHKAEKALGPPGFTMHLGKWQNINGKGRYSLKCSHGFAQMPGTNNCLRNHGESDRATHKDQLQSRVDLRDLSGLHLGRRKRKVPVPGHRLGRRQRDPAVVDGRDGQTDIATENDNSEPYCDRSEQGSVYPSIPVLTRK